jgi:hypothetical protein
MRSLLQFKVEREAGSGGTHLEIAMVAADVTTYGSSGLDAYTTFCYRVRAYSSIEGARGCFNGESNCYSWV